MQQKKLSDFELKRKFFNQLVDCFAELYNPARAFYLRKFNPFL